ncbi:cold-shock protein [Tateyamaria sp. Alg231-49]|uniref:cold-shock protein n=1 Tax=Tateyamaria sp. Alg231-49 TaxID=1922219 RepID=UPI0027958505|nr:cold shock domain-containing protein [Tateyamaria sp. Alg231-49]
MTGNNELQEETVTKVSTVPMQSGTIKWFDPKKGFGFIVADTGGPDILLHVNVLLNFGQRSIADKARVDFFAQETSKGAQVVRVAAIHPPENFDAGSLATIDGTADWDADAFADVPLEPARVKWFDHEKGYGFANVFGKHDDVFVHVDVLQRSGLSDLQPGEALAIGVVDGERGQSAVKVHSWDTCWNAREQPSSASDLPCVKNSADGLQAKDGDAHELRRCDGLAANWLRIA